MSTWYNKIVDDLGNIVDAIEYFENELLDAKAECQLSGNLEKASAAIPGITEHRFNQLQEIEAILEFLNIDLRRERSSVFRHFLEKYNRQLTSRDADKFVDGEESVVTKTMLVNQFSMLRNKYLGVMKGLDTKQWQIGHIVKLRTAGMEDVVV